MEIIRVREKIYHRFISPSVALGNFDGVHLGHQEIIKRTVASAHAKGYEAIVYTFDPHPRIVLGKSPEVPRLTTPRERADILEELGLDVLILAEFTKEFAAQPPDQFVREILVEELGALRLFIGENYRFGKNRAGTPAELKKIAPEAGFQVRVVPSVTVDGVMVSSSRIRDLLSQGRIREANVLLGRYYSLEGRIIHGHHRGKGLGFPTANLKPEVKLHPPEGVYAVYCRLDERVYPGVMNIGYNPTFQDKRVSYEAYIFNFNENIYGRNMRIYIVDRIREEMTFSGVEQLKEQIRLDCRSAECALEDSPTPDY